DLVIGFAIESLLLRVGLVSIPTARTTKSKKSATFYMPRARSCQARTRGDPRAAQCWRGSGGPRLRPSPSGRTPARSRPLAPVLPADREDDPSGARGAEVLAREALDRARVALERRDLRREEAVLVPEGLDLAAQRLGALALLDEMEDPAVAEEGADHEGDERDDRAERRGLLPEPALGASPLVPGCQARDDPLLKLCT